MGGGNFEEILHICIFLASAFFAGQILKVVNLSPILGEIAVGILLGPSGIDILDENGKGHKHWFRTLGVFGVTLMIFESGMHVHFHKLKVIGGRAFVTAVLGTLLPIGGSILFATIFGFGVYPNGIALGCAAAPTSVGIALKLLTEAKELGSDVGQLIVTSAFIDDIFSIVALVVLLKLSEGGINFLTVFLPTMYSFLFVLVGGALALKFWPPVMHFVIGKFKHSPTASVQLGQRAHLFTMLLVLILYSWGASLIGSHLLGAFMGGMSFCLVPRSMNVWQKQTKRVAQWLLRLFFACSVAFSIPIDQMLNPTAFWKGLICGIGPCILTKAVCGFFLGPQRWLVGSAMMGRGEFAYLVAETGVSTVIVGSDPEQTLMSRETYGVCVWALLCATILAPFLFRFFLLRATKNKVPTGIHSFRLKVKGTYHPGMVHEVMEVLRTMGLECLDTTVETDNIVAILTTTCCCRVKGDDLDDSKFHDVKQSLFEALNDDDGQILIDPIRGEIHIVGEEDSPDLNPNNSFYMPGSRLDDTMVNRLRGHFVLVKFMSDHNPAFLTSIWKILNDQNLDVRKGKMYVKSECSVKYFYCIDLESVTSDLDATEPMPERLQKLRDQLGLEFAQSGVRAKALVKTVRIENAPLMHGYIPQVAEDVRFAEFHLDGDHDSTMMQEVLAIITANNFDIINCTMDVDARTGATGTVHATMFALNNTADEGNGSYQMVADKIIEKFEKLSLKAKVKVFVNKGKGASLESTDQAEEAAAEASTGDTSQLDIQVRSRDVTPCRRSSAVPPATPSGMDLNGKPRISRERQAMEMQDKSGNCGLSPNVSPSKVRGLTPNKIRLGIRGRSPNAFAMLQSPTKDPQDEKLEQENMAAAGNGDNACGSAASSAGGAGGDANRE